MISDEYRPLVDLLARRTSDDAVNWQATSDEDEFLVKFDNFSLSLRSAWDQETEKQYIAFTLRDAQGKRMDNFWVEVGDADYDQLNELWSRARRKALNIDSAIRQIIEELEAEPDVPF